MNEFISNSSTSQNRDPLLGNLQDLAKNSENGLILNILSGSAASLQLSGVEDDYLKQTLLPLVQQELRDFRESPDFASKMNLAFGNGFDREPDKSWQALDKLISANIVLGDILPSERLQAKGAFDGDRIYLSKELLDPQLVAPQAAASVLLEEMGHYIDSQINSQDTPGDEGAIFAKLVLDLPFAPGELAALQAEDDWGTLIGSDGSSIPVELASATASLASVALAFDSGVDGNDRITADPTIVGTIADLNSIGKLQASLNNGGFVDITTQIDASGNFSLDAATLTQLNGGQLPDGKYKVTIQTEDRQGKAAEPVTLDFTLDTTPPSASGFMLDSLYDSAPIGDSRTSFGSVDLIGQTEANATVTLKTRKESANASVIADAQGKFRFSQVALAVGDNSFTVKSVDLAGNTRSQTNTIRRVTQDSSDVVLDWNGVLLNAVYTDKTAPPLASRNMAIVQTAVFDAVNSFANTYQNYHFTGAAPTGASLEAAAAAAAYNTLLQLYPKQKTYFDNALISSLAKIADGKAEDDGVAFGKQVADDLLAFRSNDGASKTVTYTPGTDPGDWQPTAPGFAAALAPQWGNVTPFGLTSGSQFRPAGEPVLTSDKYTADFNQVKELGSIDSTTRTADQTQIAQFWADGGGTFTPPGHWNQIAQNVAASKGNSLLDNARLFALLDMSLADAGIAAWDAKYQFNFWRPITAIQKADTDGNPNTIADPNWKPLITTPPFPEYISGHSTFSGAAATVLTSLLGDNISFSINSLGTPGIDRTFSSFNAAATEAGISRIYGGIHFNSANIDGQTTGKSIGNYVLQNSLAMANDAQPPVVKFALATDTGSSNGDKITSDPTIKGTLTDASQITKFQAKLNTGSFVDVLAKLTADGTFNLDKAALAQINGGQLADGAYQLNLKAEDKFGNATSESTLSFTLDSTKPIAPTEIKIKDDPDTVTSLKTPTIIGKAETGATVQIFEGTTKLGETKAVNGTWEITTFTLTDGVKNLTVKSIDPAGNSSDNTAFSLTVQSATVDITPPVAAVSSLASTAVNYLELTFDEPVTDAAFAADKYSLKIFGGTQDGQAATIASIQKLSPTQVRINLAAAFGSGNYKLAVAAGIADTVGNATTAAQTFDLSVAAARLTISPANGEEMVGLNRDTVVNFGKKIDPTTVNSDNFYLIANGQRIAGRIKVSSTEEFATFFYDSPLPSSTEVRIVVDGTKILGRDGVAIDGDGDGKAGGIATADFTTLPITRIKGTDVWGYVYDSYNKNADGSNIPLKGVTIRLDSLTDVTATTDDKGYFILKDVPAPEFFVYIDGAKATGSSAASQYASLGKPFHSVPGQSTQLIMDGTPFNVYLPPMAASDVKPLSATEVTKVGFGAAAEAFLQKQFPTIDPELWKEVKVTFNPGSAQDDAGNKATQATIIPVDPQRLPAPLPPGADPKLVISIQAGGAGGFNREAQGGSTNFDVPAPIQFPNLDGLKPGEKSLFWSFDHDAGKWIVIGTGTVSADGKTIVSDPGVGVIAPGWHFVAPGTPSKGKGSNTPDRFDPNTSAPHRRLLDNNYPPEVEDSLKKNGRKIQNIDDGYGDYLYDKYSTTVKMPPGLTPEQFLERLAKDLNGTIKDPFFNGINTFDKNPNPKLGDIYHISIGGGTANIFNLIPTLGTLNGKGIDVILTEKQSDRFRFTTLDGHPEEGSREFGFSKNPDGTVTFYTAGASRPRGPVEGFVGQLPQQWGWESLMRGIGNEIQNKGGSITQKIQEERYRVAPPSQNPSSTNNLNILSIQAIATLSALESVSLLAVNAVNEATIAEKSKPASNEFFYRIQYSDLASPNPQLNVLTGKTGKDGSFSVVLPANQYYAISLYNPETELYGWATGLTSTSGLNTDFGDISVSSASLVDSDSDGLGDMAEYIIGTDANKFSTTSDGISDGAKLKQGLDPLNGRGFPTGIISSLPLQGEAKDIVVSGSTTNSQTQTAYVATGSHGLAVVNASQFNNPIVLGQLNLPGDATSVGVDNKLNIAAVATNSGGLQLVNVADGMLPILIKTVNLAANKVEVADGIAYASVGNVLHSIDLSTGDDLQSLTLPGSGTVTGLAREGSKLYAYVSGSDTFSVIDISAEGSATVLGQLVVSIASSEVGLTVGNGVAYLAGSGLSTVDVSDPTKPKLISGADTFFTARNVALNGSGLAVVSAEGQGLGIYSTADSQKTDNFITQIDTPGFTYDAAIASGIAYVADGTSDLQVINYLPFDNKGKAPTISIDTTAIDLDPNTAGIQVQEGSTIPIRANITDDVQVRNVELLVDGQVVANDVSFPWDLSVVAPKITATKNTVDIQVRATDTGGNISLSNLLTLNLSVDKFAPKVLGTTPIAGARSKTIPNIVVKFDEAIDVNKLNTSGVTFTNLGKDGVLGGGDDTVTPIKILETRSFDRTLVITPDSELPVGNYQVKVDPSIISDRAGNSLTAPLTLNFTKRPLTTPLGLGAAITGKIAQAGDDEIYTFTGTTGTRLIFDSLLDNSATTNTYTQITSPSGRSIVNYYSYDYYYYNNNVVTLTESGTYKVTVKSSNNTTGDFSFRLLDGNGAPTITLGTTVTDVLPNGSLENDIYQINGKAGDRLYFDSLSKDATTSIWTLYGTGNQYITSTNLSNDIETVLPNDGTYLLVLDRYSSSTAAVNYSFKVTNPPTTTTALTLGTAVSSTIAQPGEMKEYTFTGAIGQRLYYDGLGNNTTSTIYAQLLSPSGQSVFYNGDADSDRSPFTLTEAGTYKLVIDGYLDNIGNYGFKLIDAGAAPVIKSGDTITSNLTPGLESDIYRIEGQAGDKLYFDSLINTTNATWYLYGSNNQYVSGTSLGADFESNLSSDGTYFLVVSGSNTSGNSNYSFKVTSVGTTTTALTLGTPVASTISQAGEQDIYTFTGTIGQRLYYDGLSNNTTSLVYAQLLSPSGQSVLYLDADGDRGVTLSEAGTYKLVIDGNSADTGNYSFNLIDLSTAKAITLGQTVTDTLTPGLESDIYQIEAKAGDKLYFDSLLNTSNASWTLYGPNTQAVSGTSLGADFESTLSSDGTYFLVLSGSNTSGNSNYSFKVTSVGTTTTALTLGTPVTSTISQSGEQDTYTFTGVAGQRLYYDGLSNNTTSTIYSQLISPSGQTIFFNGDADSNRAPVTLAEVGTYKLVVDGNGADTGNYSFNLIDVGAASLLSLNANISGTLDPGLKTLIYRINGTAGQKLKFDSLLTSSANGNWTLYNLNNSSLGGYNLATDFNITLPNDGTYVLAIDGNNASGTVNYNFQVTDVSDAPVTKSGFNTVRSGTIAAGGQTNYTLTASTGTFVYFDSQSLNATNLTIEVRDPSNVLVTSITASNDIQPVRLNSSGNYTVTVKGSSATSTGAYSFQAIDLDTGAIGLTLGTPISKTLTNGAETVAYKFVGAAGQKIFYDALQSDPDVVTARLISPTGSNIINQNSDSDTNLLTLTESGTYYLLLQGNNATAADFSFNLIDATAAPVLELDKAVTDKLQPGLETNIYRIDGTANQRLFFDSFANATSATWYLYNSTNQYIAGTSLSADFEMTLPYTGTYYLVLNGNNATANIDYSFKVVNAPTTTAALTIGTAVSSSLTIPGEIKEYTFMGSLGQRLYYDSLSNNTTSTIYSRLISPSGQTVFGNTDADSDRTPFTLTEAGTYKLIIDGNSADTGNFSFNLLNAGTAPTVTLGETVTSTLTPGVETNIYRINGTAGQQLYIDSLLTTTNAYNAYWTLYDPNNQSVSGSYITDLEPTLAIDGTYLLVISGSNTSGNSNYSFKVTNTTTTSTQLTLGSTVTSSIAQSGEKDIYTFTGTAGQRLLYDALINNSTSTIYAQLISPSGQTAFYNGDADSDRAPFTLTESGTYKLSLDGNAADTGDYSFRLLDLSNATTVKLATTVTDTLTPGLESDIYKIDATAGQRLFFDALTTATGAAWTLYGPNNSYVNSSNLSIDFETTIATSGTYYLVLDGYTTTGNVNYSFKVTNPTTTSTPMPLGITVTGTIAEPGEVDEYTFVGTVGQRLYYDALLTNNTFVNNAQLVSPSGTAVFFNGNADSDRGPVTLTEPGTYRLILDGSGSSTGNYSFRLLDTTTAPTITLDNTITNTLNPGLKTDVYRINGKAGQKLRFDSLITGFVNSNWSLSGPGDRYFNGSNLGSDFETTLTGDGTYLLVINGYASNGTVEYKFKVTEI